MNKMRMTSENQRAYNIEKLRAEFPEFVIEQTGEDGKIEYGIDYESMRILFNEPNAAEGGRTV